MGPIRRTRARAGRATLVAPVFRAVLLALIVAALLPGPAAGRGPVPAGPTSITPFPERLADKPLAGEPALRAREDEPTSSVTGSPSNTATRLVAQSTLGTPVAATIEMAAAKHYAYRFSSSGKQVARTYVTLKAMDAYSSTRRWRKGTYTYYLLSWGPLAGWWVRLNASTRVVAPTSWSTLVLVYRQTNLDFVNALGETRHLEATLSPATEALLLQTVATPTLVSAWSSGVAAQRQTVVYSDLPLTTLTPLGDGFHWLGPWDVAADLAIHAPPLSYDSVVVLWQPWDEDDYVPSWGWGLGLTAGPYSNGLAYATITAPPSDATWWVTSTPFPGEVYLHEWLHGVIDYHTAKGAQIPDLHGNGDYGYFDEAGSWRRWYTDFMQQHVRDPLIGAWVGINYRVWRSGTPTTVP